MPGQKEWEREWGHLASRRWKRVETPAGVLHVRAGVQVCAAYVEGEIRATVTRPGAPEEEIPMEILADVRESFVPRNVRVTVTSVPGIAGVTGHVGGPARGPFEA